ncbi:arrestin domain-containing protein 3-like [Pempheris klunzingeri]|uniref:arrestin domain-containing protein 3-like n=1 Tax=Pempheris klunzingeri TaxID=3127111 RepID=UPI00397FDD27
MFQQTFKNFNINFDASNVRRSVSSGDLITGQISFDLTKQTKITSITLALRGRASVHWSKGGGGGGGGRRRRRRKHFSAELDFFNFKNVILQENRITGAAVRLSPGTHVYPFTCQLPQGDFPSTFRGVYGHITYTLTVGMDRPWHLTKDFVTELNFVNHIDTSQPEMRAPMSGSNYMTLCCLWCNSGPITMTTSIEKKAFVPGETVKVTCKFSNASSSTATPKVKLQQKQAYYTLNKVHKCIVSKSLVSLTGQPISGNTSGVSREIELVIPPSVSCTISNCSILDIDYLLEVSLSVTASPDLTVLFPIILCDTPVNTDPPLYL